MPTAKQLRLQNAALRKIAADLQWMARRYADERLTFSPKIVNDHTRYLLKLGVPLNTSDGIVWARDGVGRCCDNLTEAQATPGTPEALGVDKGNQ